MRTFTEQSAADPERDSTPPRLRVSEATDATELEAEREAERVMSARPAGPSSNAAAQPGVVQRAADGARAPIAPPEPLVPRGGGEPLSARARDFFEPRFGRELGDVRVHTGADAAAAAGSLAARGYAVGRHVVFGAGQYAPGTHAGDRLLAHELAHVVHGAHEPVVHRAPLDVEVPAAEDVSDADIKYLWQNPTLRETIYPHRDEMLAYFLRTYMEIDLDDPAVAAQMKELTVAELTAERLKLNTELKDLAGQIKAVEQEIKDAKKAKDEEGLREVTLRARPLYFRKHRVEEDLKYLPEPTKKGLPAGAQKRWAAYQHSKYADDGHELAHDELLGRILDRFDADTDYTRYPKWLRYMVVHFSGMRYKSAHGSYAPATELVKRLKRDQVRSETASATEIEIGASAEFAVSDIETELDAPDKPKRKRGDQLKTRRAALKAVETARAAEFTKKGQEEQRAAFDELMKFEDERTQLQTELDEPILAAGAQRRLAELEPLIKAAEERIGSKTLKQVRRKLDAAEDRRRAAVVEHELERAEAALSTLDDTQAVAILKAMRADNAFPEWVWRELVRVTALKLEIEEGEDWEKVTAEEEQQKKQKDPVTKRWRELMGEWKKDVTGWRAKHGEDLSLVVVRAVCNEIAEMSLHARGVKPTGGISQKANWYRQHAKGGEFSRPKSNADLKQGASLFFLEWSDTPPKDKVNVVRSDTPDLLSDKNEAISDGFRSPEDWIYEFHGDKTVTRRKFIERPAGSSIDLYKTQYLNWTHEAQVVQVDEPRKRVITFETGPIGLRKRTLTSVLNVWSVYTGYSPSGAEPADLDRNLEDILPGR